MFFLYRDSHEAAHTDVGQNLIEEEITPSAGCCHQRIDGDFFLVLFIFLDKRIVLRRIEWAKHLYYRPFIDSVYGHRLYPNNRNGNSVDRCVPQDLPLVRSR